MKFLIILTLALASASGFELRSSIVPAAAPEGRIFNGQKAPEGTVPYIAGMSVKYNETASTWCEASVICRNHVLTAAHCIHNVLSAVLFLGSNVLANGDVVYTVNVAKDCHSHPYYNHKNLTNDIAVCKVPNIEYNTDIQPIELPPKDGPYPSYVGQVVIVCGWGRTSDAPNANIVPELLCVELRIISNEECRKYYGSIRDTQVCAIGPGSTCKGDSGAPLVLFRSNIQVGVTSFGHTSGCTNGYPTVYARVDQFRQWIRVITGGC